MIAAVATPSVADIELQLLLEAVYRYSGYDFRDYTPSFVKRRVSERVRAEGVRTISGLQEAVLHDSGILDRFIYALSVGPSDMFAEPAFFGEIRQVVIPMLRTFPFVRIWVMGCGTGEELYSLAIVLEEEQLYRRCRIYATDVSSSAIAQAKTGQFPADAFEGALRRYRVAGGNSSLEDYVNLEGESATLKPSLRQNVVFSTHNLTSDGSFNEFNLIVARNVFSQFNRTLASRAHHVAFESLARSGYLGLGAKENIRYAPHQRCYERVAGTDQIYRRIR